MTRKISRKHLMLATAVIIGAAMVYAFWPRPMMVDIGQVKRGPMTLTIDEEGRTRVHDSYVVSTPVTGVLLRVEVEAGDTVTAGRTVLARMLPVALDTRSRSQAQAGLAAAEASLRQAQADRDLAEISLKRISSLRRQDMISQAELDQAVRAARSAEAVVAVQTAQVASARDQLIGTGAWPTSADGGTAGEIPITAPASGQVLQVVQQSEATLPAGAPVLVIGDVTGDLEVVVDLLSSDAVRVAPGNRVILSNWGGPEDLNGVVERVDPNGFTKISALGVEEQRVNTIVRFTDPPEKYQSLGHGFRVEAQIIVWEDKDALIVPSNALFRDGPGWAVFAVTGGKAVLRRVEVGHNNGVDAQVLNGFKPEERVILYPSSELTDGTRVAQREIR